MSCDLIVSHKLFHVEKVAECPPSTVPEDVQRLLEFMQDGDRVVLADQNLVNVLQSSEKPLLIVQTDEPSVSRFLDSILRQIQLDGQSNVTVTVMDESPPALLDSLISENIQISNEKVDFFLAAGMRYPVVGTSDSAMYGSVLLSKESRKN